MTVIAMTRTYLERYGKPVAFYSDKHGVFRVNRKVLTSGHNRFLQVRRGSHVSSELIEQVRRRKTQLAFILIPDCPYQTIPRYVGTGHRYQSCQRLGSPYL